VAVSRRLGRKPCLVPFVGALPPTGGSSMIQGHTSMVLTLPLLFLMTVIFMTLSFVRRNAQRVLR